MWWQAEANPGCSQEEHGQHVVRSVACAAGAGHRRHLVALYGLASVDANAFAGLTNVTYLYVHLCAGTVQRPADSHERGTVDGRTRNQGHAPQHNAVHPAVIGLPPLAQSAAAVRSSWGKSRDCQPRAWASCSHRDAGAGSGAGGGKSSVPYELFVEGPFPPPVTCRAVRSRTCRAACLPT